MSYREHKPASLRGKDVSAVVTNHRVRRLCEERSQGELVAHGSGEDKQTSFLASSSSDISLEVICSRVLLEDVVEEGA
jgi:hypothetical protein